MLAKILGQTNVLLITSIEINFSPCSRPMVVQYKKADNQYQFSIQGEASEKEVEALLKRFQELLHPEPGLRVNLVLDCTDYLGRRYEEPIHPEGGES